MTLAVEPLNDPAAVDRIMRAASIAPKLRRDDREPGYVDHPLVSYWGAWAGGDLVGVFMAVRFTRWEVEAHVAILPQALAHGRSLARLFIDRMFDDRDVERITAYVLGTLRSAGNFCRRIGFQPEGRRRRACMIDGLPTDVLIYGMTREDWQNAP